MVRKLLVGTAQYILGPFGPDTDLRRYGLRLCERGGKNAKRRAAVAVARKLAVLLHCLWVSGEVYEPLRQASPRRSRRRWLPEGPRRAGPGNTESERSDFCSRRTHEQPCVDDAKTKSDLESLADNDIHRLVRVTAHKRLV